ncbi:carboxymuconolactone decarboxylase family protein [Streptacidiphilus sp. P02-A3a]|uniref:carboxymuconolactone decarboxylase family protein n=1 Tax=Streptacidiphilus sp. P02-A3a TaxID=2704468 RepID=UPI0015FA4EB0|nr:carboxymuconolactone decarboxylase family protein [Streptacidiphilus sp. P02-A3a]QMU71336.1 carboxymuconolactone decarboxylase family protein [Streptacidiphilus sp. P02-A3a]
MPTSAPTDRIDLTSAAPEAFRALIALSAVDQGLDPALAELVKVHTSQLNGCGYCVGLHRAAAEQAGVAAAKLDELPVRQRSARFTAAERAALDLAEHLTLVATHGVPDEVYQAAARHFDQAELACLVWTVAATNTWNRIGVAGRADAH